LNGELVIFKIVYRFTAHVQRISNCGEIFQDKILSADTGRNVLVHGSLCFDEIPYSLGLRTRKWPLRLYDE